MKNSLKEKNDLTVILLTNDLLPKKWNDFHRRILLEATDAPLIIMSRVPSELKGINLIQDQPPSKENIFYQMLRAMRLVKTKYIAIVEDDCVYPKDHFELRPQNEETFIYNQHRWSLYTWNPIYTLKNFIKTNTTLIAPTKLALDLLEERFKKYPIGTKVPLGMCGELGCYEKELGIKERKVKEVKSENPVVQLDHDFFTKMDEKKETIERRHRKSLGKIKALSIPIWGDANNLTDLFL